MIKLCSFFQALEEKERKASSHRENLLREQRYLKRRLELLSTQVDAIHKRRSVSECSTSTVSSSHSSHSESGKFLDLFELLFWLNWFSSRWKVSGRKIQSFKAVHILPGRLVVCKIFLDDILSVKNMRRFHSRELIAVVESSQIAIEVKEAGERERETQLSKWNA